MANYSEKQFQHCLKKVKSGLLNNPYGISIWSGYVSERNSHAVLLFIGNKKPIKTDSVSLWGQFPPSGALRKICKAFNFALFGGEIFWKEFRSCKDVEVLEKVCKLMQIQQKEAIPTLQSDSQLKRKKSNQVEEANAERGVMRYKNARLVNTAEEATAQLCLQVAQEMSFEIVQSEMHLAALEMLEKERAQSQGQIADAIDTSKSGSPNSLAEEVNVSLPSTPGFFSSMISPLPSEPVALRYAVQSDFGSHVNPARLDFEVQANTTGKPSSDGPVGMPFVQHSLGNYNSYAQMPSFQHEIQYIQQTSAPQSFNNGHASAPMQHPFAPSNFQHTGNSCGTSASQFFQPYGYAFAPPHVPFYHSSGNFDKGHFIPSHVPSDHSSGNFDKGHYAPPAETLGKYFKVHSWVKCWNARKGAVSDEKGSKGRGPRSENIAIIQTDEMKFKHPGNCQLSVLYGKECLAKEQQRISNKTSLICRKCKVFLHKECGPVYHAFFCKDRVDLQEWHAVKSLR